MTALAPGTEVHGLTVEQELGRGAYGVVYLATDKLLGRLVALKVIAGGGGEVEEAAREQVETEARLIGQLRSPYIVSLYDAHATEDGGWRLALEFVSGGGLEDEWEEGRPFELRESVRIFRGVLLALDSAHDAGVIHGDIKLGNILFGPDGLVKLADFGMARVLEGTDAAVPLHGEIFGTPAYMAPEVLRGEQVGIASDLWAATVLFYQLLAGRYPFPVDNLGELVQAVQTGDPAPVPEHVPEGVAALVARGLAKETDDRFPGAAAVLEELDAIAARHPELAPRVLASENPTNLTPAPTAFVGREKEVAALHHRFDDDGAAVVTLSGPGGVGKTRLAREFCTAHLASFPGGCWLSDLGPAQNTDDIAHGVARALGIPFSGEGEPLDVVADALRFRRRHLLVLDNCEHIVGPVREALARWTERSPETRVLVTTRAVLGLDAESRFELEPLPAPPAEAPATPEEARTYAGVGLFETRARDARPDFALDEANVAAVCEICHDLDGMPLAIELAAARCATHEPAGIARDLAEKFDFLASSQAAVSPRQRTLAGAIEWSFGLLEPWEKQALLQASVFRDGFTPEAAREVIDLAGAEEAPLMEDVLGGLRRKSLLTARDAGYGARMDAYKAIREFAARLFDAESDPAGRAGLVERHAAHYLALADCWNAAIPGPRDDEALDRIELEIGNLRAVHERALADGDGAQAARAVLGVARTMNIRQAPRRLVPMLEAALEALDGDVSGTAVRLRLELATACYVGGSWDRARAAADEAAALAENTGAARLRAKALLRRADVRRSQGDLDGALAGYDEAVRLAEKTGDEGTRAAAVGGRGAVLWQKGERGEAAVDAFGEAVRLARRVGDHRVLARYLGNIGVVHESRGELEDAIRCHREVEELCRRKRDRRWVAMSLGNRGTAHVQRGEADEGLRCYREAEEIARELGAQAQVAQLVGHRGTIHSGRGELDEALACYEEAEAISRRLGDPVRIALSLGQKASVFMRRGDFERALESYREAKSIAVETGDRRLIARYRCNQGSVLAELDRLEEAADLIAGGLSIFDETGSARNALAFVFRGSLAVIRNRLGRTAEARRTAEEAAALAGELGLTAEHPARAITETLSDVRAILDDGGAD